MLILNLSRCLITALLACPMFAQDAPRVTLSVDGVPGEASTVTIQGKPYVDVDAIVQLLGATQDRHGNRVVIYLPDRAPSDLTTRLSPPLIVAGVEFMTLIREWRRGIIDATVNSTPFLAEWAGAQQRDADSKLALVSGAANTDGDRSAIELLLNESRMMREFSEKYVEKRKQSVGVFQDEIDNDPLSQQILDCARGMASMAATHEFQDVPACH